MSAPSANGHPADTNPPAASSAGASSAADKVQPGDVGWQFVPQYYNFVHKQPDRLHCFYNKRSTFIHGEEGEDTTLAFGQQQIHERILKIGYDQCKVYINSIDSQSSADGGVIIQVLGEMSNANKPWRKFAQTFFLAEQPNGYFVLNDIFRYLKEETDEEDDEPEVDEAPIVSAAPSAQAEAAHAQQVPTAPVAIEQEKEAPAAETPAPAAEETPAPAAKETAAPVAEETPAPAAKETAAPAAEETSAPTAEEQQPAAAAPAAPTPATDKAATSATPSASASGAATPAQAAPAAPAKPAAPKSWASLAAGGKPWSGVAAPAAAAAAPASAAKKPEAPAAAPAVIAAPATGGPAATPAAPAAPAQAAGGPRSMYYENALKVQTPHCFVKLPNWSTQDQSTGETIDEATLRQIASRFGDVNKVEIVKGKACAFVEFSKVESARKAIIASLGTNHGGEGGVVHGEGKLNFETRKEKDERGPKGRRGGAPEATRGGAGGARGGARVGGAGRDGAEGGVERGNTAGRGRGRGRGGAANTGDRQPK